MNAERVANALRRRGGMLLVAALALHAAWAAPGFVPNAAAQGPVLFGAKFLSFASGGAPRCVAAGDLNGDGRTDLVLANDDSVGVSVLLANGPATFAPGRDYPCGAGLPSAIERQSLSVAIGDLDGDEHPDLVVANGMNHSISALLGRGDGTFGAALNTTLGSDPTTIVTADFDGDGRLDVAVTDLSSYGVWVLPGDGHGGFTSATNVPIGYDARSLVTGDFNGDGHADLAAGLYYDSGISVVLGSGTGSFASPVLYLTANSPASVTTGDFDGDGVLDLAAGCNQFAHVSVLMGRGDGTFGGRRDYTERQAGKVIATADFNGDGKPDLACAFGGDGWGPTGLHVMLGAGDGSFLPGTDCTTGTDPRSIVTGDFDGDGRADLAVACELAGAVAVSIGNGDGSFGRGTDCLFGGWVRGIAAGDLDGDGNPDLVVSLDDTPSLEGGVSVLHGDGHGRFSPGPLYLTGRSPSAIALADVNGDGKLDVAVANHDSGSVSILLGYGDGTLAPHVDLGTIEYPTALVFARFNGDAWPDLGIGAGSTNGMPGVALADGNGWFGTPQWRLGAGQGPIWIAAGDFDADGHADVAYVLSWFGARVGIALGDGLGGFRALLNQPLGSDSRAVAVGDFNGDGRDDVVGVSAGSGYVGGASVYLGAGDGTLGAPWTYGSGRDPKAVVVGDLNLDGHADIAIANATNSISVLLGAGDGTFPSRLDYGAGGRPNAIALGDFNRDGYPDLAVPRSCESGGVDVLLNLGAVLDVERPGRTAGAVFQVFAPSPNPSRGAMQVRYVIPARGRVDAGVFDITGRRVRILADPSVQPAGEHRLTWDARDAGGVPVAPGVYMVRVRAGGESRTLRMVVLP